ncbi:DEAD/DEAH box helicase family protein [Streptomyces sp. NPDC055109]
MSTSPEPAAAMPSTYAARRTLRPDQQHAVDAAVRHLRSPRTRGHIVSACGTGKTLTALRTAEALGARHLLVAVPLLDPIHRPGGSHNPRRRPHRAVDGRLLTASGQAPTAR